MKKTHVLSFTAALLLAAPQALAQGAAPPPAGAPKAPAGAPKAPAKPPAAAPTTPPAAGAPATPPAAGAPTTPPAAGTPTPAGPPAPTDPAAQPAAPVDPSAPPAASDPAPQPPPASTDLGLGASTTADATTTPDATTEPEGPTNDRGAFVAGGKFGGIVQLAGFGPNITGAIEVGYILPFLKRGLGVMVDVGYAAPVVSGTESDPRVQGGSYEWSLVQKQLTIFPFVTYRYTGLGKLVPYVGVGPRIALLEGVTYGMVGQTALLENKEQSTSVGVGAPLGADYAIGPGAALAELLFSWNAVNHTSTGDSSLTSFTLWVGYRLML